MRKKVEYTADFAFPNSTIVILIEDGVVVHANVFDKDHLLLCGIYVGAFFAGKDCTI